MEASGDLSRASAWTVVTFNWVTPLASAAIRFRSVLALAGPDGSLLLADGTCEGVILAEPKGDGGFGYDPLFWMPDQQKTLAEMTVQQKNAISHRGNALKVLKQKLLLQLQPK